MSKRLLEWIRVGRIHTAALTMPITLLGYVLAGGRDFLMGFLWILFGLFWHYFGFLQNNLFDLKYDIHDPAKQHFPLVRGTINVRTAWIVDITGLVLLFLFGVFLAPNIISICFMVLGAISGTLYNVFSKRTLLKVIPISICFSSLPIIPYASISKLDILAMLLFVSVFTTIAYQIGFSGELKDYKRYEVNILRMLGRFVPVYAWSMKLINLVCIWFLFYTLSSYNIDLFTAVIMIAIMAIIFRLCIYQIKKDWKNILKGRMDRKGALTRMSMVEVFTYILTIIAVSPVLGWYIGLWIVLPIVWFIIFNKLIFGTTLYPKV